MIRAAGQTLSRRCLTGSVQGRRNPRPAEYSTGGGPSAAASAGRKLGLTGAAAVGVGGVVVATGFVSPAIRTSLEDKLPFTRNVYGFVSSPLSTTNRLTVSAKTFETVEGEQEGSLIKKKKKKKKAASDEEPTAATTSSAVDTSPLPETSSTPESAVDAVVVAAVAEVVPEDFTAIPPPTEALHDDVTPDAEAVIEALPPTTEDEAQAELQETASTAQETPSTQYLLETDMVDKIKELELEQAAENQSLETILATAIDESTKAVSDAVVQVGDAADTVKNYTILLKKALDDSKPDGKKGAWEKAVGMSLEKDRILTLAHEGYGNAKQALTIALQAVEGGRTSPNTRDNPKLLRTEERVYKLRAELDDRFTALEKAQSDSRIMKAFTDLVEQGKQQFNAELKALMPDIKLNETGSKLSEAELNLLIAYAHRWIMQLQRQLAEYQLLEEQHLNDALLQQKLEDEGVAQKEIRDALEDQKSDLSLEKERSILVIRKKAEEDLLAQLKRQAAAHSQHLKEVLNIQEEDYANRLKMVLTEGIAAERVRLEGIVREAFSQLMGIESAIESRGEAEKFAKVKQDLWVAVTALKQAVGLEHRIPLGERSIAVLTAAGADSLISTLVDSIPAEAKEMGIFSNAELKSRFEHVREICKKVSLVTDEGGLFQTILSFLNYKITNESVLIKPAEELTAETAMLDLVCHAQWYVEHGDLESALRCMNQLRGEPRRTAFDWITETRVALETRQAVNALHSWVSALNLGQFPPEMKN